MVVPTHGCARYLTWKTKKPCATRYRVRLCAWTWSCSVAHGIVGVHVCGLSTDADVVLTEAAASAAIRARRVCALRPGQTNGGRQEPEGKRWRRRRRQEESRKNEIDGPSTRVVTSLYVSSSVYTRNILNSRACGSGAMSGKLTVALIFPISSRFTFILYSRVRSSQMSHRPITFEYFPVFPLQRYKIIICNNDLNTNNTIGIWQRWNL